VFDFITAILAAFRVFFVSRLNTSLEVLALRQQVAVLKRKRPRPSVNRLDRFFWTTLRAIWPRWSDVLLIVKPETVIAWHRASFRLYWRWRSRPRGGRPRMTEEIRVLIRRIASDNTDWGAPKIHGELQILGFDVSERTVARYLRPLRPPRGDPAKRWLAFLANHREVLVAMDFFTVPTLTFRLLYCFFVIGHERRKGPARQRNPSSHFRLGRATTAGSVSRRWSLSIRPPGPRLEIRCRRDCLPEGNRSDAEAHRSAGALAKRDCGTMGRQLSARDPRPRDPAERTAPAKAGSGLRELPSR